MRWRESRSLASQSPGHNAQNVGVWHAQVLELQLGGVVRGAQGVHDAAHVEALRVGVDDEAGDAAAALLGVGAGEHEAEVGPVRAGDEHLGAVDDPVAAVLDCARSDGTCGIAAARGLANVKEAALFPP
jgi:hypothetical protein